MAKAYQTLHRAEITSYCRQRHRGGLQSHMVCTATRNINRCDTNHTLQHCPNNGLKSRQHWTITNPCSKSQRCGCSSQHNSRQHTAHVDCAFSPHSVAASADNSAVALNWTPSRAARVWPHTPSWHTAGDALHAHGVCVQETQARNAHR